ncbi:MAG TPA: hypothetical protein VNJ08_05635 [Bacteriovoracaceae bacterium]|nr:hypothetical protein [Bacteriovoracaceae bacterium]
MKLLAIFFAFVSLSAFAGTITTLECEMASYPKHTFSFKMKDLGRKTMGFINQGDNESPVVFVTKSKKEIIIDFVATLNGQGGDLRILNDRIHFLGVNSADLELLKESGFKTGFARMGEENSTVLCKEKFKFTLL